MARRDPNQAKDGHFYWVDTTIVPFLDDDGQPYKHVVIRNDITERVNSMAAHRESEERLKRIIEHSAYGKLLMDQHGTIQLVNGEIEKWLQDTVETIYG